MASSGMPWETGASEGKYRYHPGGDPSQAPKDAPSALNVIVVPDVTLPKVRSVLDGGWRSASEESSPSPFAILRW